MIIVQVTFKVKTDNIAAFIEQTKDNVRNSLKEEGVKRFEFYRESENEDTFILFEIYTSKEDQLKHRDTEHFRRWKGRILDMIQEPYSIKQYELATDK